MDLKPVSFPNGGALKMAKNNLTQRQALEVKISQLEAEHARIKLNEKHSKERASSPVNRPTIKKVK